MKNNKGQYIVIDTISKKYLCIGSTTFYKTPILEEATIFPTREKAKAKVIRECIHYIIKYKIHKLPERKVKK